MDRVARHLCCNKRWEKQIGALLCSVDLNKEGGVFSLVGHSAQGSITRLGTIVHQIWTVSALRSCKCGLRSREDPSVPSFLLSSPSPLLHAMLGEPLGQPLSCLSLGLTGSSDEFLPTVCRCVLPFLPCSLSLVELPVSLSDFAPETSPGGRPSPLLGHGNQVTGKCF